MQLNLSGISFVFFSSLISFNMLSLSEFLLVHLRHAAAAVLGHVSSDRIHHGLEDEGVQRGEGRPPRHRAEVHAVSHGSLKAAESTILIKIESGKKILNILNVICS